MTVFALLHHALQTVIKSMGWNLVGPVVRCLLRNGEEDERKDCFLVFDLLVKVSRESLVLSVRAAALHCPACRVLFDYSSTMPSRAWLDVGNAILHFPKFPDVRIIQSETPVKGYKPLI